MSAEKFNFSFSKSVLSYYRLEEDSFRFENNRSLVCRIASQTCKEPLLVFKIIPLGRSFVSLGSKTLSLGSKVLPLPSRASLLISKAFPLPSKAFAYKQRGIAALLNQTAGQPVVFPQDNGITARYACSRDRFRF